MLARLLLIPLVLTAWGCASAEGAYADGMEHETAGDYAAAADAYVNALERDPAIRNVPGRLAVAGREAVRLYLAQAAAADAEGAAQAYLDADDLVQRAAGVGVEIERPASFEADRDAALAAAVDALAGDAADLLAAGDFGGALGRLGRARAFRPSPEQEDALTDLAVDAHTGWAEADLAAGRYRSALTRTETALRLGPADPTFLEDLRLDVLDAGYLVAAVFPVETEARLPRGFARDLFDVLVDDRLVPGPFIGLVDPAEVRRWDRQRGRRGTDLAAVPRRLATAALDLGADVGVVVEVEAVTEQETVGQAQTRTARFRSGGGFGTYTVRTVRLDLTGRAAIVAAEAGASGPVCDRLIEDEVRLEYDVASYDGDPGDLDLSRGERAAFRDDAAALARDDGYVQLRESLAGALAAEVTRCLDGLVP